MEMESASPPPPACENLPPVFSSFVDAFVDFSVSGIFFPTNPNPDPPPTRLPSPLRLVAIGDLHGDLPKSISALSLAGLVDPFSLRWTGGPSVAVQVGDVLDRGGDELRLLHLLHRLKHDAAGSGGQLVTLHGNHEIMNSSLDFRYATPAGFSEFRNWSLWFRTGIAMKRQCAGLDPPQNPFYGIPKSFPGVKKEHWDGLRARIAALRPNGPIAARFLTGNQTVLVVGDSVFVHGGLLQGHVEHGLERINDEVRDWISGAKPGGSLSPRFTRGRNAVVWLRKFSEGSNCDCGELEAVLGMIPGARRMVTGHTIQDKGITAVCGGRAIRVDVGLSKGCSNGLAEVLEINHGVEVRVLTSNPVYNLQENKVAAEAVPVINEREQEVRGLAFETGLNELEIGTFRALKV